MDLAFYYYYYMDLDTWSATPQQNAAGPLIGALFSRGQFAQRDKGVVHTGGASRPWQRLHAKPAPPAGSKREAAKGQQQRPGFIATPILNRGRGTPQLVP